MQNMKTTLVTGATGNVGGQVAQRLLDTGANVRVAVRDLSSEKATAWKKAGAEVVHYDYSDVTTLRPAMDGVDRLFLMTPMVEDPLPLNMAAIDAARDAGVSFVAKLSAIGADPLALSGQACMYGQVEAVIKGSGLDWSMLQPTFYMTNLVHHAGETIRSENAFYGASDGNATSYVSPDDVAHVAAIVLSDPDSHRGQSYVLTGPQALTENEVACILSDVTGRKIMYQDIGLEGIRSGMIESGSPQWLADGMVDLESSKVNGVADGISPSVEKVTGLRGETFEQYARRNAAAWKAL